MNELKRFVIVFMMFLVLTSCKNMGTENNQTENVLYPVYKSEKYLSTIPGQRNECKWGYIDKNGKVVVDFLYDYADFFSEGLARVRVGDWESGKWGFIDATGKVVIAPQFDEVFNFSEGLSLIRIGEGENKKHGFINKKGEIVIEPKYFTANSFSEGLAKVLIDRQNSIFGFIDYDGNVVMSLNVYDVQDFSEGLAAVASHEILWGYIDHNGDFAIKPQFQYASDFSEGLAAIIWDDKIGFVDKAGNMVIEVDKYNPRYSSIKGKDESLLLFSPSSWGYQIHNYMNFINGVACIRQPYDISTKGSFTRYIDKNGKLIGTAYSDGRNFSEGLAAIKEGIGNDKYGYINEKSKLVINYQFDDAEDFHDGLARVIKNGKMAYIDKTGTIIWREP